MHTGAVRVPRAQLDMGIHQVGDTVIRPQHRLSCHCGSVVLELSLPDGIVNPRRCDCSICRRKGAVVASIPTIGGALSRLIGVL